MAGPNTRSIRELVAAVGTIAEGATDIGTVLTDQRLAKSDAHNVTLIQSQMNGVPKGVLITWEGVIPNEDNVGVSQIVKIHSFFFEFIYPYSDKKVGGLTSWALARDACDSLITECENHRTLGLLDDDSLPDQNIRNRLLRTVDQMVPVEFGKGDEGSAIAVHYTSFRLPVETNTYIARPEV